MDVSTVEDANRQIKHAKYNLGQASDLLISNSYGRPSLWITRVVVGCGGASHLHLDTPGQVCNAKLVGRKRPGTETRAKPDRGASALQSSATRTRHCRTWKLALSFDSSRPSLVKVNATERNEQTPAPGVVSIAPCTALQPRAPGWSSRASSLLLLQATAIDPVRVDC